MNLHSNRSGFTLTELMVSMTCVGILAAIALPTVQDLLVRAKVAQTVADLRILRDGVEAFALDTGRYPVGSTDPPVSLITNYDARLVLQPLVGTYLPSDSDQLVDGFSVEAVRRIKSSIALDLSAVPDLVGYSYFDYAHFLVPPWQPKRAFALTSLGPDRIDSGLGIAVRQPALLQATRYEPSNGLRSSGDIGIGSLSLPSILPH
ncbi:MAG TPA: prepilin-type N-terminal cleavage/methylation domain-containing protein [bacterium]|nr:prepilin-type N-terminal cleavage/methylation domain-containing protein [bacterium]HPO09239.1 prepilin-type N-terminal cleavage/methylation domain-containing protein [bacterium]HQO34484.1 prepilin-type N-terminal cleavage/methylation domain-containing protein [bacterium]HQP97275.1 prepilin-type N-terminal cleavage/methylation domain-containing protein [bacterium]